MSNTNNDVLSFYEEPHRQNSPTPALTPWKLLVVDDENEVHLITRMVLKDYLFEGRPLQILDAHSGQEAREVLTAHADVAVILLDVVMETDHSGLDLVKWIREDLGNAMVRIILRTGQPGAAPEKQVIIDYEINDYKAKTELTSIKLFTAVTAAIRAWRDLKTIRRSKEGFHKIIAASSEMFSARAFSHFIDGVLTQLTSLLSFDDESLYIRSDSLAIQFDRKKYTIVAGTGSYQSLTGLSLDNLQDETLQEILHDVITHCSTCFSRNYYVGFFPQEDGTQHILVLRTNEPLKVVDQEIIRVFSSHVAMALENVSLNQKIESTQKEIIFTLGEVLESRSKETGNHVRRVASISYLLAKAVGLSETEAQLLRLASPMHDVGKIGISDKILNKPGQLTGDELTEIRKHTVIGYEILRYGGSGILKNAAMIAWTHHERWDGLGYPAGLKGEEIPLSGRITAVADVLDALTHQRVYKQAWTADEAFQYIFENAGTLFDPQLVGLLVELRASVTDVLFKTAD